MGIGMLRRHHAARAQGVTTRAAMEPQEPETGAAEEAKAEEAKAEEAGAQPGQRKRRSRKSGVDAEGE